MFDIIKVGNKTINNGADLYVPSLNSANSSSSAMLILQAWRDSLANFDHLRSWAAHYTTTSVGGAAPAPSSSTSVPRTAGELHAPVGRPVTGNIRPRERVPQRVLTMEDRPDVA